MFSSISLKQCTAVAVFALLSSTAFLSSASERSYHIPEHARSALLSHQSNPSATSDPMIDAMRSYLTSIDSNALINPENKAVYAQEISSHISSRDEIRSLASSTLKSEVEEALSSGDTDKINVAYQNYYDAYKSSNELGMQALKDGQRGIAFSNTVAIHNGTQERYIQHTQATSNFLTAYIDEVKSKKLERLSDDHAERVSSLISSSERANDVLVAAQTFSDVCSACVMPVIPNPPPAVPVDDSSDGIDAPTLPPAVSTINPPKCGGWEYDYKHGWVRYNCD